MKVRDDRVAKLRRILRLLRWHLLVSGMTQAIQKFLLLSERLDVGQQHEEQWASLVDDRDTFVRDGKSVGLPTGHFDMFSPNYKAYSTDLEGNFDAECDQESHLLPLDLSSLLLHVLQQVEVCEQGAGGPTVDYEQEHVEGGLPNCVNKNELCRLNQRDCIDGNVNEDHTDGHRACYQISAPLFLLKLS